MSIRYPSPDDVQTIKQFLTESSGLFVEGVEFGRPASGISMRVHYRDFYGNSHTKTMLAPNCNDFQDVAVLMSEWLDALSGVAQRRIEARKKGMRADA